MYYYELKTKTEIHCLEPRIFGGFDYGVYDLKHNLLKKKREVKQEDAAKFIFDLQKKLAAKFVKIENGKTSEIVMNAPEEKVTKKEEKKESPIFKELFGSKKVENMSTDDIISGLLGRKKTLSRDSVTRKDGEVIHKNNNIFDKHSTKEEYDKAKGVYKLVAVLDYKTGIVSIESDSCPADTDKETADRSDLMIKNLLRCIVQCFPDLVDNQMIADGQNQTGADMEDVSTAYNASTLKKTVKIKCLETIKKAITYYNED